MGAFGCLSGTDVCTAWKRINHYGNTHISSYLQVHITYGLLRDKLPHLKQRKNLLEGKIFEYQKTKNKGKTMYFKQFFDDKLAQYAYLVGCQANGTAVVIDPMRDIDQYIDAAAKKILPLLQLQIHTSMPTIFPVFVNSQSEA
jgi:hypothetical protein